MIEEDLKKIIVELKEVKRILAICFPEHTVLKCPSCGSIDIKIRNDIANYPRCYGCGYSTTSEGFVKVFKI